MESKINLFIQLFFFGLFFVLRIVILASIQFADQSPLLLQQHINHSISFFIYEFSILCMSAYIILEQRTTTTKPHLSGLKECMRSFYIMEAIKRLYYETDNSKINCCTTLVDIVHCILY